MEPLVQALRGVLAALPSAAEEAYTAAREWGVAQLSCPCVQTYGAAALVVFAVVLLIVVLRRRVPVVEVDLLAGVDLRNAPLVASPDLALPERPGRIQCYAPSTLQFLGEVAVTTPEGVREAVTRARAAQAVWATTSFAERRRVLACMHAALLRHADDLVTLSVVDTGKTGVDAQFGELLSSLGKLDWVSREGEAVLAPEPRRTNFMTYTMAKAARVEYAPLGVLGVIAPWNYPCYNLFNHIASGLFAGNAVVAKISEYAAWSAARYARLARECLLACGHNPDLVQLVQGFGETGAALVASADKVIFTGSPAVGKLVMRGAAPTLTPLTLELGGKDPLIVCSDASLDAVVPVALRGTFQNAGQNCVGVERVLVDEALFPAFMERAAAAVARLRVSATYSVGADGRPAPRTDVDVGAVTTAPQLALIQELVEDAVARGAVLRAGGHIVRGAAGGLFFAPTLLAGVTRDMRIAQEEVFGPVLAVFRTRSDDEAVAIANSTKYGLGATVFSASRRRAEAIAARLRCGMVGINSFGLNYLVQDLPFGGVGESGFERFSGPEGLRACCVTRSIVSDRFPWLVVPMSVPAPLQYPLKPFSGAFVSGLLAMLFETSPLRRVGGLLRLATAPLLGGRAAAQAKCE